MNRQYEGRLIKKPTLGEIRRTRADYEVMLVTIMDAILERFERDPSYPYVNTKLSVLTGEDFPEPENTSRDFRGKTAIYGWIQGRGLEALAGHVRWLPKCSVLDDAEKRDRIRRLSRMLEAVLHQMETLRARNNGRLSFLMTPEGRPFTFDETGRRRPIVLDPAFTSTTELFYPKGMFAAASLLLNKAATADAKAYFRAVAQDIESGRHHGDQVSFDPKNKVAENPKKHGHGPRMIILGGFALFAELLGDDEWFDRGERFIRHIVEHHINTGRLAGLQPFDFVECIDSEGKPWSENSRILSDPGHSLEFIGLASKFLLALRRKRRKTAFQQQLLAHCAELFPHALARNFANGFNPRVGGICKAFDLVSRRPINSDMPWWSLPETMRAGAELLLLCPREKHKADILRIIADCSNGFMRSFVNRKAHLMAYQTVDANGQPADVIPATPDADPGYHTGLSIIDFLACLDRV